MQEATGKLVLNVIRFTDLVTPEGLPMMRQSFSKDIFAGVKALEKLIVDNVRVVVKKEDEEQKIQVNAPVPEGYRSTGEDWSLMESLTVDQITKPMVSALRICWKDREDIPQWATVEAIEELKTLIA
jgi:hypothetical protein